MNQKIVKHLAIALAILLIVTIFSFLLNVILSITNVFNNEKLDDFKTFEINEIPEKIELDTGSVSIKIEQGNEFIVKTNNAYVTQKLINNKLVIEEKKHNWFSNKNTELILTIPSNHTLNSFELDSGAGKINIESLQTNELSFDLGAGKVEIKELIVLEDANINGGAGSIQIKKGKINNLDFDMGVGKVELSAYLTGKNEIDAGVGEVDITLLGKSEDYQISVNKGIGSFKIENEDMKDQAVYGNGDYKLIVDGGIGSIEIDFENN